MNVISVLSFGGIALSLLAVMTSASDLKKESEAGQLNSEPSHIAPTDSAKAPGIRNLQASLSKSGSVLSND